MGRHNLGVIEVQVLDAPRGVVVDRGGDGQVSAGNGDIRLGGWRVLLGDLHTGFACSVASFLPVGLR